MYRPRHPVTDYRLIAKRGTVKTREEIADDCWWPIATSQGIKEVYTEDSNGETIVVENTHVQVRIDETRDYFVVMLVGRGKRGSRGSMNMLAEEIFTGMAVDGYVLIQPIGEK